SRQLRYDGKAKQLIAGYCYRVVDFLYEALPVFFFLPGLDLTLIFELRVAPFPEVFRLIAARLVCGVASLFNLPTARTVRRSSAAYSSSSVVFNVFSISFKPSSSA